MAVTMIQDSPTLTPEMTLRESEYVKERPSYVAHPTGALLVACIMESFSTMVRDAEEDSIAEGGPGASEKAKRVATAVTSAVIEETVRQVSAYRLTPPSVAATITALGDIEVVVRFARQLVSLCYWITSEGTVRKAVAVGPDLKATLLPF